MKFLSAIILFLYKHAVEESFIIMNQLIIKKGKYKDIFITLYTFLQCVSIKT